MDNQTTRKTYGIFNKHNGVIFAYEDDKEIAQGYNKDNFLIKEIVLHPNEYYYGDYHTGRVYSSEEKPLVREDELEENFYQGIIREYSLIKQITILVGVFEKNEHIVKTEGFNALATFLKQQKKRYDLSLEAIKNDKESFNFVSLDEVRDVCERRLQGIT
jgi:hypothetical protein